MEYSTVEKRINKKGNAYFIQKVDDIEGNIIWKGRCKKSEWEWHKEIVAEQPNRIIYKADNMICIKN